METPREFSIGDTVYQYDLHRNEEGKLRTVGYQKFTVMDVSEERIWLKAEGGNRETWTMDLARVFFAHTREEALELCRDKVDRWLMDARKSERDFDEMLDVIDKYAERQRVG